MCGRVAQAKNPTSYGSMLKVDFTRGIPNAPPHYNGAPGQDYLIARAHPETENITLDLIRWGLLPSWAKDRKIAYKFINARAETIATSSAFKKAFAKRRCLVPVDGFFEWKKVGKEKRPYMIAMTDREPFTLAGLWENWKDPDSGEWVRTFTIVTTDANDLVGRIHDRMPAMLVPSEWEQWLDPMNGDVDGLLQLLGPADPRMLEMFEVSTRVNSVRNNDGELIRPLNSA